jgi:hypothetical protein
MLKTLKFKTQASLVLIACVLFLPLRVGAEPVQVRHTEGLVHGFLLLSTTDGTPLAQGDLIQFSRQGRVTNHLTFHFKDGSIHDETTVFSQRGTFRLLRYHLVQKGPTFPHPKEMTIEGSSAEVTVHYTEDGKEKVATDRLKWPADVSNGMMFTLLKNIGANDSPRTVSMVASTPKPRMVKVKITHQAEEPFSVGGAERKAMHYVLKVELGLVAGAVATVIGKQPSDIHVWVLEGEAPAFVKSEGPLFAEGPIWRIELTSPVWPSPTQGNSDTGKNPTSEK